jgi:hypothetical protein
MGHRARRVSASDDEGSVSYADSPNREFGGHAMTQVLVTFGSVRHMMMQIELSQQTDLGCMKL